jgi:nucleotide-binding universal stress UspA family protein
MITFERLLVPLDFSRCSRRALSVAACFSQHFGSRVDVIHVFDAVNEDVSMKPWDLRPDHLVPAISSEVAARTKFWLAHGPPGPRIRSAAIALEANLIVTGLYGPFGDSSGRTGRVTEHLMRHAPCVVVAVDDGNPLAVFDLMNLAVLHTSNARTTARGVASVDGRLLQ